MARQQNAVIMLITSIHFGISEGMHLNNRSPNERIWACCINLSYGVWLAQVYVGLTLRYLLRSYSSLLAIKEGAWLLPISIHKFFDKPHHTLQSP